MQYVPSSCDALLNPKTSKGPTQLQDDIQELIRKNTPHFCLFFKYIFSFITFLKNTFIIKAWIGTLTAGNNKFGIVVNLIQLKQFWFNI